MSSIWQLLGSLAAAGTMLVSAPLQTAAPHQMDGPLLLTNRDWAISGDFVPRTAKASVSGSVRLMQPEAADALEKMFAACRKETGRKLTSVSGYRSYARQQELYRGRVRSAGQEAADSYVALPGTSEHQTGLCIDIAQLGSDGKQTGGTGFAKTKGGQWVRDNAWRFGFIIRYQEGWEDVTGYSPEPWHIRYVGEEAATAIHEAQQPLELWLTEYREQVMLSLLTE